MTAKPVYCSHRRRRNRHFRRGMGSLSGKARVPAPSVDTLKM
jgi:hypothetical protein